MRIRTLILVSTVLSGAAALAAGGGLYATSRNVDQALGNLMAAHAMVKVVFEQTTVMGDYLLYREERARIQWERSRESLGRLLDAPRFEGAEPNPALATLRANHRSMNVIVPRLVNLIAARRSQAEAGSELSRELERRLVAYLLETSQAAVSAASRLARHEESELARQLHREKLLGIGLGANLIIVLAGTWLIVAWRVVRPIRRLQEGIRKFGAGDPDARVGRLGNDEIGEVAEAFDEMAETLRKTTVSKDELERTVAERTAELTLANQELQAFSYSVSHDLRAPLRAMDGFSRALIEDYGDKLDDTARDYLGRIRGAAQRMAQLIDDILILSRVSRRQMAPKSVSLSDTAEEIGARLRDAEPDRDISLHVAPGLVDRADEGLAHVILENLLGNAWKFTKGTPRARIDFGAEDMNGTRVYFVRDNGAGFDMAYAGKLFEPFQRLHSNNEYEGTGIGLATVARAVRLHGGRIWAESEVGEGTTLHFTLDKP